LTEIGVKDEAAATISIHVPQPAELKVLKQVAAYSGSAEGLDGYTYQESVSFNSSGQRAVFKVTVTNTAPVELVLTAIEDKFNGSDLSGATFYLADGTEITLAQLLEEYGLLEPGTGITFYYITAQINATGTYINNVTVIAAGNNETLTASDSALVTASWGGGTNRNDPTPPPLPTPLPAPEVIITEAEPPLSDYTEPLPEPESEILEEIVPLADLPQTGVPSTIPLFLLLTGALSGMCLATRLLNKKSCL
jgi:hypothetical protein